MLFPVKPESKMLEEMLDDLVLSTGINDLSVGAIARSILEVFNRKLHSAYMYLDIHASLVFLSTSSGPYLDLIGFMLSCTREPGESDSNYKFRISQQVFTAATANETAIRLKCLSVEGVRDVILTEFTRGSGSFTVHVIADEIDTPEYILEKVKEAVAYNKSEGVRAIVTKPKTTPMDIEFSIIPKSKSQLPSAESLQIKIKDDIQEYIDNLGMGTELAIQKLISLALLSDEISQVLLTSFKIDNEQIIVRETYQMEWDQRCYIRDIKVSII